MIVHGHGPGRFGQIDGRPAAHRQHEIADYRIFTAKLLGQPVYVFHFRFVRNLAAGTNSIA